MRRFTLVMVWLLCAPVGSAEPHPCARGEHVQGKVSHAGRGNSFYLLKSNQAFVLADIVGVPAERQLPLPTGIVDLYFVDRAPDRYSRQPVHLFYSLGWWQGELLQSGQALSFALGADSACLKAMLDAESKNTASKANHWQDRGLELRATDLPELLAKAGNFVLVTGIVLSVGDRTRRLYLNFGQNWAQDFTVSVAKTGAGKFAGNWRRLTELKGRKIRVRGVLESNQGPLIRVIDDAQIQIIN